MQQSTCLSCNSTVVPKRRMNWLLLIFLNVFYLPFYFLSKKRCPICRGQEFTTAVTSIVPKPTFVKAPGSVEADSSRLYDIHETVEVYSDVSRRGVQAMESAYIVATSKTLDTVVSRYRFLEGLHKGLVADSTSSGYKLYIQQAIDQFKSMRYNTIPESYQMQLVLEPGSFDLAEFYAVSLEGLARRSIEAQIAAIKTLKKDDAKHRRMTKIVEDLKTCLEELDGNCRDAVSYTIIKERLTSALRVVESGRLPELL